MVLLYFVFAVYSCESIVYNGFVSTVKIVVFVRNNDSTLRSRCLPRKSNASWRAAFRHRYRAVIVPVGNVSVRTVGLVIGRYVLFRVTDVDGLSVNTNSTFTSPSTATVKTPPVTVYALPLTNTFPIST